MAFDEPKPIRSQTPSAVHRNAATTMPLGAIQGIKIAALIFDFSFWEKGSNKRVQLLAHMFSSTFTTENGILLDLQCKAVPIPGERPFLVADCVAIWLHRDDPLPSNLGFDGEFSMGEIVALPTDLQCYDYSPFPLSKP